jgi:hypothetical protein
MMQNRGIFDIFSGSSNSSAVRPSQFSTAPDSGKSPFTAVPDTGGSPFTAAPDSGKSPFTAMPESPAYPPTDPADFIPHKSTTTKSSPFMVIDDADDRPVEPFRPAKIPEKRKTESPFQIAEPSEGYGTMPTMQGMPAHAPEAAFAASASPFTPATDLGAFTADQPTAAPTSPYPAQPFASQTGFPQPAFAPPAAYASTPAPTPAPVTPAGPAVPDPIYTLSSEFASIRQIELRAIFGVDREMRPDEILQRCRALPGIRNVACIEGPDASAIESLKAMLSKLGFGGGALRIYTGSVPVEFIREGNVLLAVQTDGGFAPGVRETLMIVVRELARQ